MECATFAMDKISRSRLHDGKNKERGVTEMLDAA